MSSKLIYLDYNATTPIEKEVQEAMIPFLSQYYGNPSSIHSEGVKAKLEIEKARKQVSILFNCSEDEVFFTSGGTESNNWAIKGIAFAHQKRGKHIITSAIEHPATIQVCKWLEEEFGFRVTYLPVDSYGAVRLSDVEQAICKDTILITIMHANSEVGTLQPIAQIAELGHQKGIFVHTDASQSVGKVRCDVQELGVDLMTVAGHKLYAPKGVGILFIKKGTEISQLLHGAGHERGMRSGTENILHIVGIGKACEVTQRDFDKNQKNMFETKNLLFELLNQKFHIHTSPEIPSIELKPGEIEAKLNGRLDESSLPNTLSISFKGIKAYDVLHNLRDFLAISAGSACHSHSVTLSSVLKAMGVPMEFGLGTIRFSTGRFTTKDEIQQAASIIEDQIKELVSS